MNNQTHINDLLSIIHGFSQKNKDLVWRMDYKGWNAWQLLKKPVYYYIKNTIFKQPKAPVKTNKYIFKRLWDLVEYICKVFLLAFTKPNSLLVLTKTNTKLSQNEKGEYLDIIFDHFLLNTYKEKFIYIEASDSKGFKEKVAIKHDLDYNGGGLITFFLKKLFSKDQELTEVSKNFTDALNRHFVKNELKFVLDQEVVKMVLLNFYADYLLHRAIFYLLRPKAIFFEDAIPTGGMAAAKSMKIKNFEFQHGFFSKEKPDYIMAEFLKPLKYKMVLPDYFCVFGQFPKDMVIKSGFWDPEELLIIGNYRIEQFRNLESKRRLSSDTEKVSLLLATQPSAFAQAYKILNQLVALKPVGLKIIIKCHIRDPEQNQRWFSEFAEKHPDLIEMAPAESNLVKLMLHYDIMASFFSTAIFEAAALSIPVITIGSEEHPGGVYDFFDLDIGEIIKRVKNANELYGVLESFRTSDEFRNNWLTCSEKYASYFYDKDYEANLMQLKELTEDSQGIQK